MDTFSLIAADRVIKVGGIRQAAKTLFCPPSTIGTAFARLENCLAVRVAERTGTRFVLTLEGRRLAGALAVVSSLAKDLHRLAPSKEGVGRKGVSLHTLERFIQVARCGSIRRAARALRIGQPQLSRQMSSLEENIGSALFIRSVEGTQLTVKGVEVLNLAEEILGIWKNLSEKAPDRFHRTLSTVRLGAIVPLGHEGATARLLARLAAHWQDSGIRTTLLISNTIAQELLTGLQKGLYDLAILDTPPSQSHLESRPILRLPLVLAGSSRYFQQFGPDIGQLLASAQLAATSLKSGLRQKLDGVIEKYISPNHREHLRILEIDSLPTIINLIMDYNFVSLLPKSSVARLHDEIHCWEVGEEFDLDLRLVWPATATSRQTAELAFAILSAGKDRKARDSSRSVAPSPGTLPLEDG